MGERVSLDVMPVFTKGCAEDPEYLRALREMLEAEGVESIWALEHVVVAEDREPRCSRLVVPVQESGSTDLEVVPNFVRRVQDIIGKL